MPQGYKVGRTNRNPKNFIPGGMKGAFEILSGHRAPLSAAPEEPADPLAALSDEIETKAAGTDSVTDGSEWSLRDRDMQGIGPVVLGLAPGATYTAVPENGDRVLAAVDPGERVIVSAGPSVGFVAMNGFSTASVNPQLDY